MLGVIEPFHEGERLIPDLPEDGGYSGATEPRGQLEQMLPMPFPRGDAEERVFFGSGTIRYKIQAFFEK